MKYRKGFVSNSSSSSFIVLGKNLENHMDKIPEEILKFEHFNWDKTQKYFSITLPVEEGEKEFGWEFERYTTFRDKLNFTIAQIMCLDEQPKLESKYKQMLINVLNKHVENGCVDILIDYNYFHWDSIIEESCHIDHQSAYYEWVESWHDIFLSEDILENFLFNTESYIQCGNDNEDPTDDWVESHHLYSEWRRSLKNDKNS